MKKIFTFLVFFIFTFCMQINAQVTISATNQLPIVGDSIRYYNANSVGFDPTGIGPLNAKEWNYSSLSNTGTVDLVYVNPSTLQPSDGSNLFPSATLARRESGVTGYTYYQNTINNINRIGLFGSASNYLIYTGTTAATEFHFPISYGGSYNSNYHGNYSPYGVGEDSVRITDGTISIDADMQGQMTLPTGVLNNILRIHVIENFHIKAYMMGMVVMDNVFSVDNYFWFTDMILQPLLTYSITTVDGTAQTPILRYQSIISQPTVITTSISGITSTTAASGGNVTSDGGASVTSRGVCWSTSSGPVYTGNHTTDGTGTGSFTSNITGLAPSTTYYVRAYAVNSVGPGYGNELTFTTSTGVSVPTVTTTSVSSVTSTSANSGGNVTSDGGASVTSRGVCWSTSSGPVYTGNHTTDGTGTGSFTSNITGLSPSTTYYVRAYAVNSAGPGYGTEYNFTTGSGTGYPTVTTNTVTNATGSTALCGGNVISDGGASVTARGVCWSTSPTPVYTGNHTSDGTGTGTFTSNITGLTPNTTYYVRAYALNSVGPGYGNEVSFITPQATSDEVYMSNIAFISLQQDASQTNVPATMSMNTTNPENYVNPGYKIRFKMECFNHKAGGSSIVSGLCKIRTTDPYLVLIDSTSGLNNVGWNQPAWSTDEFEVQINGTTPYGHVCYVNFVVIENSDVWYTYNIPIPIAPLTLDTRTIDDDSNPDSNGDNDGLCEFGEVIETLPLLENVSPLNASYNYGEFINYLNYGQINVWDNHVGASGTVVNESFWNYLYGSPQIIVAGATGMSPQYDFVFDYNFTSIYHFYLALKMSGKFELFLGTQSYVKWLVQIDYNFGYPEAPVGIADNPGYENIKIYPNPANDHINIDFGDNFLKMNGYMLKITNTLSQVVYTSPVNKQLTSVNLSSCGGDGLYFVFIIDDLGNTVDVRKIVLQ